MSSGCRLGAGGLGGPVVTWRPAAAGEGGAALWYSPSRLGWAGVVWVGVCGGEQFAWAAFAGRGGGSRSSGVCAGGVCGPTGGPGLPWGAGLPSSGVCGLSIVGGGEGGAVGGSVAGVCWRSGGWGRPVSRGPGMCAMVGMCGSPGEQREGRGMGGNCAVGRAVSVYVSARSGAPAWSVVGRAVCRRSLPSSAAAAMISQMSLHILWTAWSVLGRGYASSGLRPMLLRTLWMAWYPQVREFCGLGGGFGRVSGSALICVWAVGKAQIQGTVPVGGQRRWIQWVRQSMASPRW